MSSKKGFGDTAEALPGTEQSLATPVDQITTETCFIEYTPYTLPIGVLHEGQRLKSFTLTPYTGDREVELGKILTKFKNRAVEALPPFLAKMVGAIGGIGVAELSNSLGLGGAYKLFDRMALADVLTILLQIRIDNVGRDIYLSANCPNCSYLNVDSKDSPSDLSTTEVVLVTNLNTAAVEVTLADGVTLFEETLSKVLITYPRMCDLTRMAKAKSEDRPNFTHELMFEVVVGLPNSPYTSSFNSDRTAINRSAIEHVYSKMTVRDRNTLKEAVQEVYSWGPAMSTDMVCARCGHEDWSAEVGWQDLMTFLSGATPKRRR
jgi:hypothetical protein